MSGFLVPRHDEASTGKAAAGPPCRRRMAAAAGRTRPGEATNDADVGSEEPHGVVAPIAGNAELVAGDAPELVQYARIGEDVDTAFDRDLGTTLSCSPARPDPRRASPCGNPPPDARILAPRRARGPLLHP